MSAFRFLFFFFLFFIHYFFTGCQNTGSNDAAGNSQYGDEPKSDTTASGAPEITDMEYGKVKEQIPEHGNPAADNQTTVGKEDIRSHSDSISNPQSNPEANRKINSAMSGKGESGHAPASKPPAVSNDPNNKAQPDTIKY